MVIRGVSALIGGEETSSHMNLSDLSCRMCLVSEVVVFCAATRIKAFLLSITLVFEVVVSKIISPHQAFFLIDALVFEVVVSTIISPHQAFFLYSALEFEVVEFCLFNLLQVFVLCVVMVFEVTACGVAVHIIFNVGVREFNGCFVLIQGD